MEVVEMMVGGRGSRAVRRHSRSSRPKPWGTIAATVAVVLFLAGVFGYGFKRNADKEALTPFAPSASNQDPSRSIPGVVTREYRGGNHVKPTERVAYDQTPPFGGPHDAYWAACDGVVYEQPVRTENIVHSLEHGAVWIAYNPARLAEPDVAALRARVQGQTRILMSPYPNLDAPVSLQSWGHQLKVDSARDERIGQFVQALRGNQYTHPEVGAPCDALGPGQFDPTNPPPFDPNPPGPGAVPVGPSGPGSESNETARG